MKRYIAILMSLIWILPLFGCVNDEQKRDKRPHYAVATVNAVGDIYLTDAMMADAKRAEGYDFSSQFEDVILPISYADLTIGNFEGNFIGRDFSLENGFKVLYELLQTTHTLHKFKDSMCLQQLIQNRKSIF